VAACALVDKRHTPIRSADSRVAVFGRATPTISVEIRRLAFASAWERAEAPLVWAPSSSVLWVWIEVILVSFLLRRGRPVWSATGAHRRDLAHRDTEWAKEKGEGCARLAMDERDGGIERLELSTPAGASI
jgi:hypothetical protein